MDVPPILSLIIGLLLLAAGLALSPRGQMCSWGVRRQTIWAAGLFALALIAAIAALGA